MTTYKYRMRFFPNLVLFGILVLVVFALGFLVIGHYESLMHDEDFIRGYLVMMTLMLFVFTPLYTWAYVSIFKVTVSEEGLRGFSGLGVPVSMGWDEIERCRSINLPEFRFLRLYRAGFKRPLWFPLLLVEMDHAKTAISEFAGEDNCLRQFLEGRR